MNVIACRLFDYQNVLLLHIVIESHCKKKKEWIISHTFANIKHSRICNINILFCRNSLLTRSCNRVTNNITSPDDIIFIYISIIITSNQHFSFWDYFCFLVKKKNYFLYHHLLILKNSLYGYLRHGLSRGIFRYRESR